ncbi:MAG: radical SAM protein [Candidatus Omnitrophica bacterium]|nr:radical SAM protein [Candidatus Omnitrophota bacterium]
MGYFYGPVYSRRLGFSLGADIIQKNICSFDCLYCQLGKTIKKTNHRFSKVDQGKLIEELRQRLSEKPKIDFITISGSGEPTLCGDIGKVIKLIKKVSKRPVCVITNSSLLNKKSVRNQLLSADLIIPSLDAPSADIFRKINRPHTGISFNEIIQGLIKLRQEFKGKIWLEVMLLKGVNDKKSDFINFKNIIDSIAPDKIHLNTPVRPTPCVRKNLMPSPDKILLFKSILGQRAMSIISRKIIKNVDKAISDKAIIDSLKRRPQTIVDLAVSLQIRTSNLKKRMQKLLLDGKIQANVQNRKKYFLVRK